MYLSCLFSPVIFVFPLIFLHIDGTFIFLWRRGNLLTSGWNASFEQHFVRSAVSGELAVVIFHVLATQPHLASVVQQAWSCCIRNGLMLWWVSRCVLTLVECGNICSTNRPNYQQHALAHRPLFALARSTYLPGAD